MPNPIPPLLITPESLLQSAFSTLAQDRRSRAAEYANLLPRTGSGTTPPRLMSDTGFLINGAFSYVTPSPAHVTPPADDVPRTVSKIVLVPYGLDLDDATFRSAQAEDAVIRSGPAPGLRGLMLDPLHPSVLLVASVSESSRSDTKNAVLIQRMTQPDQGPAYHFVIDRDGGIAVGPPLDYQVSPIPARAVDGIFVALEGQLGITQQDYQNKLYDSAFEMPYTDIQLFTLSVLLQKLITAYGDIRYGFTGSAGVVYESTAAFPNLLPLNFQETAQTTPVDFSLTTSEQLRIMMQDQGTFDLATEVFVTTEAPAPTSHRSVAREALHADANSAQAALRTAMYGDLAAQDRATDLEIQPRTQMFVIRGQATHQDADAASGSAGGAAATTSLVTDLSPAMNPEASVYDYTTGCWGNNNLPV